MKYLLYTATSGSGDIRRRLICKDSLGKGSQPEDFFEREFTGDVKLSAESDIVGDDDHWLGDSYVED